MLVENVCVEYRVPFVFLKFNEFLLSNISNQLSMHKTFDPRHLDSEKSKYDDKKPPAVAKQSVVLH